ncbi:MAG: neutral/alkaline non-lysosomal ceramidase N-terminal domain-containing protein [Bacteroidetes bacterium]|nr:neutral/alkaline non-lysosomal ceramidase N-terminal domain-containing protein [Bacteroidota bacterium]
MTSIRLIQSIIILLLAGASTFAQQTISAGTASVDISPDFPIALTGYGGRAGTFEKIEQKLWAKALAMSDASGKTAILITTDLIGFPASLADQLAKDLEPYGIQRHQLAVTATHTHTGPETGILINITGEKQSPEQLAAVVQYQEALRKKLKDVTVKALESRKPSILKWGKGSASFAMNRRMIENGKWVGFGKNDGPAEHDLPILQVVNSEGKTTCILMNYACHGTTLVPKHNYVHGDWMGDAQLMVEEKFPGAQAMVVIGCGADSDPQPRGEAAFTVQHGQTIANEASRLLSSNQMMSLTSAPVTAFEKVPLHFDTIPDLTLLKSRALKKDVNGLLARSYLETRSRGEKIPDHYLLPVQVWNFGNDLTMIFMGGEVVVDYVRKMKQELGPEKLWMNAYSNDVSCYIASERLYNEGGYEVDFSMAYYNKPSRFRKDTETRIVSALKKLYEQTRVK